MRSLRRGEIFRLKGDAVGKPRRVLVVSPQHLNGGIYVTVVPFYSQQLEKRRHHRSCVFFHRGEFGLTDDCVAKTDEVTHLKLSDLRIAEGSVGFVNDDSRMQEISRALCYSLDIQ